VLGAFDEELLVGTVMVGHDGHRGWVCYLAVEDRLRANGVVKVQLMVRSGNDVALGFYEHLGYEDANVQVRCKWLIPPTS
jgi:ribosomal protein S18 acetylase RimI-like enzyme